MKRRQNTIPKKIRLTEDALELIDAWAEENEVSFSAAIESLARLGMGQDASIAMIPVLVSVTRREIAKNYTRLVRLMLFSIYESGTAARFAGATAKALKPTVYDEMRDAVQKDAKLSLKKRIRSVLDDAEG
ncbi:MAG: hypothetical protein H0X37_18780 [Herpetosiphonaceae bacterium]|nr:hypothetical protein [Herpetosiphonaceae bacterium]